MFGNQAKVQRTRNARWLWMQRGVLMALLGLALALPATPAFAQDESTTGDDALQASTLTVNVELILDASGSMAEEIPGTENQSRMDAAQAAMREVIASIPEREGLNVGFRVYGHEGSNSEADRAASCRSTELLVPMSGLDKDALLAQVEQIEPTGWTPLSLALESAAADFSPGGESVTNAVIMVTDGEETCGGDPCQIAGALHAADIGVTTHVVGFALTREQRQAVTLHRRTGWRPTLLGGQCRKPERRCLRRLHPGRDPGHAHPGRGRF